MAVPNFNDYLDLLVFLVFEKDRMEKYLRGFIPFLYSIYFPHC